MSTVKPLFRKKRTKNTFRKSVPKTLLEKVVKNTFRKSGQKHF